MQASQLSLFFQHLKTELAQAPNEIRRLFHGRGRRFEGLEQITCDWLQGQLIINLFKEVDDAFLAELKSGLIALAESETVGEQTRPYNSTSAPLCRWRTFRSASW